MMVRCLHLDRSSNHNDALPSRGMIGGAWEAFHGISDTLLSSHSFGHSDTPIDSKDGRRSDALRLEMKRD